MNKNEYIEAYLNAAKDGQTSILELLLKNGVDINSKNKWKDSALILAVDNHQVKTVKFLIDKGINLNNLDYYGETALFHAISTPDIELVKLLVKSGSDVNIPDQYGTTCLMQSCKLHSMWGVEAEAKWCKIYKQDNENTADFVNDFNPNKIAFDITQLLLENNANVDIENKDGINALDIAAMNDDAKRIDLLLDYSADINHICKTNNFTPLMNAIDSSFGHLTDAIKTLVQRGADINIETKHPYTGSVNTALTLAIASEEIREFLLKNGGR